MLDPIHQGSSQPPDRTGFPPRGPVPRPVFAKPYVTPALIGINVAVFLAMLARGVSFFEPTPQQVLPWGANFGPLTTSGEPWRLLTACFLHFGIVHIAMNMYILHQIGMFTERLFGNVRYLLLYLLAGVGGNIAGLFFHPLAVGAGASGAIFGVYGGLLGFLLVERTVVPRAGAMQIAKSAGIFLLFNLVYGLARPETDLVAHAGGLVTGFVAGCLLAQPLTPGRRMQSAVRTLAVAMGAGLLGFFAVSRLPKDSSGRNEWIKQVLSGTSIPAGNQDRLIYTGIATKQDAEMMAKALDKVGFFRAPKILLLFQKTPHGASISLPMKGDEAASKLRSSSNTAENGRTESSEQRQPLPWEDPAFLDSMRFFGPQLASAAGGVPFTMRLLNENGELRREIPIETTEVATARMDRVSYSGQTTVTDATALLNALGACGYFKGDGRMVFFKRDSDRAEISFPVRDGSWSDSRTVASLREVGRTIAPAVGGPPITIALLDSQLQVKRELTVQ